MLITYFVLIHSEESTPIIGHIYVRENEISASMFYFSSTSVLQTAFSEIRDIVFIPKKEISFKSNNVGEYQWEINVKADYVEVKDDFNYLGKLNFSDLPEKREDRKVKMLIIESFRSG